MTTFVERAPRANETRLVSTIVAAFLADPAARWLYPDVNRYLTHFPDFVRAFAGKAFEYRTAEVVSGFDCAALWLPPLVEPDDAAILDVIQGTVAEELLPDVMNVFA